MKEWCEYMRDVIDLFHLTNDYIAQEADVSVTTVERIKAINTKQDIMRANARRIELVVLGHVGKHICEMDYDDSAVTERINSLLAEVKYWKKEYEYFRQENDRKAKIIDKYLDT